MKDELTSLLQYATDTQAKYIQAIIDYGNSVKAAEHLGVSESAVRMTVKRLRHTAAKMQNPIDALSPNETPAGFSIERISKHIDKEGKVSGWVIANRDKEEMANSFLEALSEIAQTLDGKIPEIHQLVESKLPLLNNYISNDIHIGALMWGKETGDKDYDLLTSGDLLRKAIDYLMENSPRSKYAVVSDLGDMLEIDDFKNATPKSGHNLDVDGRYSKILTVAIDAMIYFIERALQYHEIVYFVNIDGNHDTSTAHAIREAMRVAFRNNPRAIIDTSPRSQKYIKFGKVIIGYAHGDGLRMNEADGTMTVDCIDHISDSVHREFHFGHNHKDKIYDGKVCRSESHRNIAPLNGWASHAGFRRQLGTMKCITYCPINGRKNVTVFNVDMDLDTEVDCEPMLLQ